MKIIYTGYFVNNQQEILDKVTPRHSNIFCHHLTEAFRPDNLGIITPGKNKELNVIGYISDEKCDALVIGDIEVANGPHPHITLSCADGVMPFYSNELFKKEEVEYFDEPFNINTTEGYFDGDGDVKE